HVKANSFFNSRKDLTYKVRGQYNQFNGASIQIKSGHTGEDLAKIPGVKRVWPVERYQLPKPKLSKEDPTNPLLTSAHEMTGVDFAQKTFKYTGKGYKIGIIDSGVDYSHPALGGCLGKGCRVVAGHDFVGDDYDKTGVPVEDEDPIDHCNGHGTHVAGIVGADARKVKDAPQKFVGVAPDVQFGAYRIFSCAGSGASDIIMKSMERAFEDKMDLINMSLGSGSAYRSTPLAVLADKLVAKGMAVVASAGNDGSDGVWSVSNAGLGATSTSVASFDNIQGSYNYFSYGGADHPYAFSSSWGKPLNLPADATLVPVFEKDGSLSDGCVADSYAGQNVAGKVVLVLGDTTRCKSGGRGAAAKTAGAAGMLVKSVPLGLNSLGGNPDFQMASIEVNAADELLAAYQKNPATTFKWSSDKKTFRIEGGGSPSGFSSWGFDGDLHFKPDIAGPGGNILSTYPQKMGSYAVLSGTSMSSPYVAGAHAILFNALKNKKIPGQDSRRIFMNTAIPGRFFNSTGLAPVTKQGAGLINVKNAITVQTLFSPDKVELLDSTHFAGKRVEVKIKNLSKKSVVYTLGHEVAESAISYRGGNSYPLGTPILENDVAKVKFNKNTVSVGAGKTVKVTIQFKQPSTGKNEEFPFYSGYIVATPKGKDSVAVRIPYAGVKGDIGKVPILDTDSGLPVLI
ncbi:MAG: peptidase S8/S53 domain-containing protein, partial [Benniella sp.]